VSEAKIVDDAVTSGKLADNSVVAQHIRDNAVSTNKIGNQNVTEPKLASNAVITRTIADNAVSTSKIQNLAIDAYKIAWGSVATVHEAQRPAAFVVLSSRQNVAKTVFVNNWHTVDWDIKRYETPTAGGDLFDISNSTRMTIRYPGIYALHGSILWEDGGNQGGSGVRRSRLRKNGTTITGAGPDKTFGDGPGAPYRIHQSFGTHISCNVGDIIDVQCMQNSDAAQSIIPEGLGSHLSVTWVAPAVVS
jgi:hypothetical protein